MQKVKPRSAHTYRGHCPVDVRHQECTETTLELRRFDRPCPSGAPLAAPGFDRAFNSTSPRTSKILIIIFLFGFQIYSTIL